MILSHRQRQLPEVHAWTGTRRRVLRFQHRRRSQFLQLYGVDPQAAAGAGYQQALAGFQPGHLLKGLDHHPDGAGQKSGAGGVRVVNGC